MTAPCYKCDRRTPDCHGSCPAYLDWKAGRDAQRAEREKQHKSNDTYFRFKDAAIKRVVRIKNFK